MLGDQISIDGLQHPFDIMTKTKVDLERYVLLVQVPLIEYAPLQEYINTMSYSLSVIRYFAVECVCLLREGWKGLSLLPVTCTACTCMSRFVWYYGTTWILVASTNYCIASTHVCIHDFVLFRRWVTCCCCAWPVLSWSVRRRQPGEAKRREKRTGNSIRWEQQYRWTNGRTNTLNITHT